jgi:hypothetical protein
MSEKKTQFDIIRNVVHEAKSYQKFEDIEKLVEVGTSLVNIPVQPLYMAIHTTSADQVANILPKLSSTQRQVMLDLDLWKRDVVNVDDFEFWIEAYTKCKDDQIVQGFVNTEDFLLYLRSRVNIWTFDVEDPEYPDHDYYFLTDDSLLLIEYSDSFRYPNELKYLIRQLYATLGVENAYSKLFKMINDNFSLLQEDAYQLKKERLRDFGMVDYFEATQLLFPFASGGQLKGFIKKKTKATGGLASHNLNQTLHAQALVSFDKSMQSISDELMKVKSQKRLAFLQFSFVRLINSSMAINDAFKASTTEQTRIGQYSRAMLELGLQFVKIVKDVDNNIDESYLEYFDFMDLYKIGNTLIEINKKQIKKALSKTPFDSNDLEFFLGSWWCSFLENTFMNPPKVKNFGVGRHPQTIQDLKTYDFWNKESQTFIQMLPLMSSYFQTLTQMKGDSKLQDDFYLNYEVENIDFESILISSFINFTQQNSPSADVNKLGLTLGEFKRFVDEFFVIKGEEYLFRELSDPILEETLSAFKTLLNLEHIESFDRYLHGIISEHLSGYEFNSLAPEDYQHVGGPILLSRIEN